MHNISDLQLLSFPDFGASEATLTVFESGKKVSFNIARLFTVKATQKCTRGFHAHKECTQLLIALSGECRVTCDDGKERKDIVLNKPSEGLLIPSTIWAEQEYDPGTVLMVLTDMPYNENDYIRDYSEFLNFRDNK